MSQDISDRPARPPVSPPSMLTYEPPEEETPRGSRPWWVYVIAGVYLLILIGLSVAAVIGVMLDGWNEYGVPLVISVGLLLSAQVGLVAIPIRSRGRRPVSKRSLWVPIIASGFLAAVLFVGAAMALGEWAKVSNDYTLWLIGIAALLLWAIWGLLFWLASPSENATPFANRLHRYLLAGSVLELLIAVPTHVVVRRRQDCCAGMATGLGICIGVVVMFLAFGPSIVLLFYRRWQKVTHSLGPKNAVT